MVGVALARAHDVDLVRPASRTIGAAGDVYRGRSSGGLHRPGSEEDRDRQRNAACRDEWPEDDEDDADEEDNEERPRPAARFQDWMAHREIVSSIPGSGKAGTLGTEEIR